MNQPAHRRIIFLAGMLVACAAFAGNDVNKCITASGHVTLTDEACPADAATVKVINGAPDDDAPAATVVRTGAEHYAAARMPTRYAALARATEPARGLALDVATLKAARANMHLFDAARRAPRLAGLQ